MLNALSDADQCSITQAQDVNIKDVVMCSDVPKHAITRKAHSLHTRYVVSTVVYLRELSKKLLLLMYSWTMKC